MSAGQVVALIAIVTTMYLPARPQLMSCMVYKESSYKPGAVNGIHRGLGQYNPDTWEWFVEMALADPLFIHADVVRENPSQDDPVVALLIMGWAIRQGHGNHWATYETCKGEQ